ATFVTSLLLIVPGTAKGQVKPAPPAKEGVMKGGMGKGGPAGAKGKSNPDDPNAAGEFGSVTIVTDKGTRKKLEAARDFIQEKKWPEAVKVLQGLLDLEKKEDVMVEVPRKGPDGRETVIWVSVHRE